MAHGWLHSAGTMRCLSGIHLSSKQINVENVLLLLTFPREKSKGENMGQIYAKEGEDLLPSMKLTMMTTKQNKALK